MSLKLLVGTVMFLVFLVLPTSLVAQTKEDDVIRVNTELVILDTYVLDKTTQQPIDKLTVEDFEVYEDETKQTITYLSQDKLPLSIIFLLDLSGSMRPSLEKLRKNALEVLQLLKVEDEVAIIATARKTALVLDFTQDKDVALNRLKELNLTSVGEEGIYLHESLYLAGKQIQKAKNPFSRRVIIVITDNKTMPSLDYTYSQKETLNLLLETGATICGLFLPESIITANVLEPWDGDINTYANKTGGEVLQANDENAAMKLCEIVNHLRTRYSLSYIPSNSSLDGKFRRIKVKLSSKILGKYPKLKPSNCVIKTRSGYYAKTK